MMRRLGLAALMVVAGLQSAAADAMDDCRAHRNPDIRLRACSAIITSSGTAADIRALALQYRGEARTDAGAFTDAIADFGASLRINPGNADAFAGRGRAKFSFRDYAGAIADLSEAIRMAPATAEFSIARGHVYLAQGNADAAIADLNEAIRLNPRSTAAFNNRGLAYRKKGDLDLAHRDYSTALTINPAYALAYANRGHVEQARRNKLAAIDDFQQALFLDPSIISARDGLKQLGAERPIVKESERRVARGKSIAEKNCSTCHAVGAQGKSPNEKAPAFRDLRQRHTLVALREPITRAIAAPHDQMPQFLMSDDQTDTIIAYINSLARRR